MRTIDDNFIELFNKLVIDKKNISFFDIISPKEVLISEWLSFIFDPSRNGVGNLTIEKLLHSVNIDKELSELEFISTETEVSTDKGQRIDLLIKYNGLWIVIENKIDSHENGNQTKDYYEYIESKKNNNEVVYIYLKPNYNDSIPKSEHFMVLTYSRLIEELKSISEFDYQEMNKYKYLKEFLVSGDMFMENDELDINDTIRFYIKNKDTMSKIEQEYVKQNKRLHKKLRYDILNFINEKRNDSYYTDDDKSVFPRSYIQYFKSDWKNETHTGAHFELLFHTDKLLSDEINCEIVLHLEGKITEEDMNRFSEKGIARNRTLAYDLKKEKPICYAVELNFYSIEHYNNSLEKIKSLLMELIEEYEKVIDEVL